MKKRWMAAVWMAAAALVFTGCGSGAAAAAQDEGRMGQESQDTEKQDTAEADGADGVQGSEEAADGARGNTEAADGAQGSEETADGAQGNTEAADGGQEGKGEADGADNGQGAGKSLSILGDSISTFRDYNPEGYAVFFPEYGEVKALKDTWWQQIIDEFALTLYVNGSSAGATVAGDSTGTEDPRCACNELRTGALTGPAGACPEIIIVFLGTNDLLNGVPMGMNDGTMLVEEGEIATFSDAYTLMLDKLLSYYPVAEIYCCTLLPVGDYGTDTPYVDFVTTDGLMAADYSRVITQIAENKGLSVIELQNCGISVENLHEMTTDGVHPTAEGMACIAEAVKRAIAGQASAE